MHRDDGGVDVFQVSFGVILQVIGDAKPERSREREREVRRVQHGGPSWDEGRCGGGVWGVGEAWSHQSALFLPFR